MITRAQDYQFITPVGVVDGEILPKRDKRTNGSAHALRTEDLCFAIEAARERDLSGYYSSAAFPAPSHVLRENDWETIWQNLRSINFHAGSFDSRFPRAVASAEPFSDISYTQYTGALPTELSTHFPNAYVASCFSSVASKGHVLDVTSMWRGLYYDILRADRLQIGQSYNGSYTYVNSYGNTYTNQVSNATNEPTGSNRHLQEIAYDQEGSTTNERLRSAQFGIASASLSTSVPLPGLVSAAKLVALYSLWVQPDAGYKPGTYYFFTRSYNVSVSGSSITVPVAYLLPQANFDLVTVCGNLGHTLPQSILKTGSWNNTGAWVQCPRMFLVVNYNFRTEIRSLNWQWTP